MKLTKYAHACIVLEEQDQKLVIDPGVFTPELGDLNKIAAVVVTHEHQDHFNPDHLKAIFKANPSAQLFTTIEVAQKFKGIAATVVKAGFTAKAGPFSLEFGGEQHADIHATIPHPHNTSVLVNEVFYYPGDSYTPPTKPVKLLAVPANAPWMKVADSMDFLASVKHKQSIPTHNGLLSDAGNTVYNSALQVACEAAGGKFTFLQPGESLEF